MGAKYAPALINFQNFWGRHITHHDPGDSYEVAELVELYNAWCESKTLHIAHQECLDWLQRESHPMGGAVKGIRCALWDKTVDIENALELFKHDVGFCSDPEKVYAFYVARTQKHSKMLVSKAYFMDYIS